MRLKGLPGIITKNCMLIRRGLPLAWNFFSTEVYWRANPVVFLAWLLLFVLENGVGTWPSFVFRSSIKTQPLCVSLSGTPFSCIPLRQDGDTWSPGPPHPAPSGGEPPPQSHHGLSHLASCVLVYKKRCVYYQIIGQWLGRSPPASEGEFWVV